MFAGIEENTNYLRDVFLDYVQIETTSAPLSKSKPSTPNQLHFLAELKVEIDKFALGETKLFENGYLVLQIPANSESKKEQESIGFVAHVDTAPDCSGKNVRPQIIENYDGKDIKLSENLKLSVEEFPDLKKRKGDTIITTDGRTLLGADDKSGVAEIVTFLKILKEHPEIEHSKIYCMFTTDEEIGRGVENFPKHYFTPDYAFTMDGSGLAEVEYECFNAYAVNIEIQGHVIHLGKAKNKLENSIDIAQEFIQSLPQKEKPESTEKREGYYCPVSIQGSLERTSINLVLRDYEKKGIEQRIKTIENIKSQIEKKYKNTKIEISTIEQYKNMREYIPQKVIDSLNQAVEKSGLSPISEAIRGGTDGARLSEAGIPCPNIFAGGKNFHSRYEWVSLEVMKKSLEVMLNLL